MEDWVKLESFDRPHQAEIRKTILEQNNINAVVINAKDSLFLIGEYELYVRKEDEKMAHAIIEEFQGLTKVDSFILSKPLENLRDILIQNGISAAIKKCSNPRYVLNNFELFVPTEDIDRTMPYLNGEKLEGWSLLETCVRTRQTRFRVELLNEKHIPTIVIKKRDSQYMKAEIDIYVKTPDLENARQTLSDLIGWIKISQYTMLHRAEIRENLLGKHGIRSIIVNNNGNYDLYVECSNEEKSIALINEKKEWKKTATYTSQIEADYAIAVLEKSGIEAVTITRLDRSFNFIFDVDLYVDDLNYDAAVEILNNITGSENE
ncbi:MAG: DUF2007 domain-containing protein [Bacteroidales bacterium]|nr:DUF2007 domain-containing protein [Bacteroidales bacterium]